MPHRVSRIDGAGNIFLYGQIAHRFIPTDHNFNTVISRYHEFRTRKEADGPRENERRAFIAWLLRNHEGMAHGYAVAHCYPLGASQLQLYASSNDEIATLATATVVGRQSEFLDRRRDAYLEGVNVPTVLKAVFIAGSIQQRVPVGSLGHAIFDHGVVGNRGAANIIARVGRNIGRHFSLLDENSNPTQYFHQFFQTSANDDNNSEDDKNVHVITSKPFTDDSKQPVPGGRPRESALTVANSRWYVQAERWLNILNKATIFDQTLGAMCLAGKACGPLRYDPSLRAMKYVGRQEKVVYQDDVPRSTLIVGASAQSPVISTGFSPRYDLGVRNSDVSYPVFSVGAGQRNLDISSDYYLYEPYSDFSGVQLGLTQSVINSVCEKLVQTNRELATRKPRSEISNDVPKNGLCAFVDEYLLDVKLPLLMVQGPPGTGKTYTLGKTVEGFEQARRGDIVCVAKTRRAVDEISRKLSQLGVFHTNRNCQDNPIPDSVHCCTINSYLARNSPLHSRKILLIDEVSQLTLPFIFMAMRHAETIRLFGDQKQLHPIIPIIENPDRIKSDLLERIVPRRIVDSILSDRLGRDRETFVAPAEESIFEKDAVMSLIPKMLNHPMGKSIFELDSRSIDGIPNDISSSAAAVRFRLVQGYRMNAAIQRFPNAYWYDNALQAPPKENGREIAIFAGELDALTVALNDSVVFITYVGDINSEANTSVVEQRVIEDITKCWKDLGVDEDGCGVVVPFRAQEAELVGRGVLKHTQCATVERFQGRDLDRAIVSLTTNTHSRFLTETRVFTENKYNVAITRAKDQLVIVGSKAMFDGTILDAFEKEAFSHPSADLLEQYPKMYLKAVYEHYQFYKNHPEQASMLTYDASSRKYKRRMSSK